MANKDTNRRKILALERMFLRMRPLTMKQILDVLNYEYGIEAERKSIYTDIMELAYFLPIVKKGAGAYTTYQIAKTADELEERRGESMPRIYDVFSKEDGALIASGTSIECAEELGIQRGTFNTYAANGGCARYRIVDATDNFVKKWDETVAQLRKLLGVEK
jgi:hypothetical protein